MVSPRVNSGFKSVRDLLGALLGAYGFWYEITRAKDPSLEIIIVCGVMVGASGLMAFFRLNGHGPSPEEVRRIAAEVVRESLREVERKPTSREEIL